MTTKQQKANAEALAKIEEAIEHLIALEAAMGRPTDKQWRAKYETSNALFAAREILEAVAA